MSLVNYDDFSSFEQRWDDGHDDGQTAVSLSLYGC